MADDSVRYESNVGEAEIWPYPAVGRLACNYREDEIHRDPADKAPDNTGAEVVKLCSDEAASRTPFFDENAEADAPRRNEVQSERWVERASLTGKTG